MKLIQAALTHHPDGITLKAKSDQAPAVSLFNFLTFAAMPVVQRAESFTSLQPA